MICSLQVADYKIRFANLHAESIDGATHSLQCTAVSGAPGLNGVFSTKTVSLPASGSVDVNWSPQDFGYAAGSLIENGLLSVTCILPAGGNIRNSYVRYDVEVGN